MSLQPLYEESETLLGSHFRPGQYDVICNQRGKDVRDHNHHFHQIIDDHLEVYSQCKTRLDKSILVLALVDMIRERGSPGGGFIKFCHKRMRYVEIGDRSARQKVAHALRKVLQTFNEKGEKRVKSSTIMQEKKEKGCSSGAYALLTSSATPERQRQELSPANLLDMFLATELNTGTRTTTTPHNMIPSQIDDSVDFDGSIEKLKEGWLDELERAFFSNNVAPVEPPNSYGNRVPSSSSSHSLLPSFQTHFENTFHDLATDSFSSESKDILWGDLDIESIFQEE